MITKDQRKHYVLAFILGLVPFLAAVVPHIVYNHGVLYFYGDYNVQQLPLSLYLSRNLSELRIPQFDFNAGSGLDYLAEASSFNLLSPFSLICGLLYALLPFNAAIWAISLVIVLKFGAGSLGAYIYISRFCKTDEYALIGGLLYAYSGFQMINLIFGFIDGIVFFPFLLAALEAAVTEKKRAVFGVTVFICAVTNYSIFGYEAVFLVIYFLIRLTDETFRINAKDFLCLALESILGVMAAGIILIPAAVSVISNPRLGVHFQSIKDMLLYESPWRYPRIIQSIFMMPDMLSFTFFFPDDKGDYPYGTKFSLPAMYLPMFGISGVIAFISANKKKWQTKLFLVCLIFVFIPVLNSIFSMGSALYYARWVFVLTLILAAMTACALESEPKYFKTGIIINVIPVLLIVLFGIIFPIEKLDNKVSRNEIKWTEIAVTLIGLLLVFALIFKVKRDHSYKKSLLAAAVVFVFIFSEVTLAMQNSMVVYVDMLIDSSINSESYIDIEKTEQGSRITATHSLSNYSLFWGSASVYSFNTIVNPYMVKYCEALEISKDDIPLNIPTLCLMSAKTHIAYYNLSDGEFQADISVIDERYLGQYGLEMFEYSRNIGRFLYYENTNYIPMGFCYEYCISEEDFLSLDVDTRRRLALKAMVVDDVSEVSEYLTPIPAEEIYLLDNEEFSEECSKRAEKTAYSYTTNDDSYIAEITLDEPELVFFSVAYDEGFTAYVDGEETKIVNANFGFQAVPVPAGTHKIQVKYHSVWRDAGFAVSVIGVSGLVIYTVICCILHRKRKN